MDSSDEWWAIDGTSLHQYGWSVTTVGGARYDLPPRRGENITLAYRPGALHRNKLPDARTINLLMWLTGTDPATGAAVPDPRLRWNDSWDLLRRLVWKPGGRQITLTRRWWLTQHATPVLVVADAKAEIADTMQPTMNGRHHATFAMTLLLADPFFYGTQVVTNLSVATPVTVENLGHDTAGFANLEVDLIGPLTNPRLTNATATPDVWVQYTGTVAPGQTLRLSIADFRAIRLSDQANLVGGVTHSGARSWMALLPGDNVLTLSGTGAGSAQVRFRPPYI